MIRDLLVAGMNVARLNFSHGDHETHESAITIIREEAAKVGREIAIFADLQGPKIRTNEFEGGSITVKAGDEVRVIASAGMGHPGLITTKFAPLIHDGREGDRILLDDGLVELKVTARDADGLTCRVERGGPLKDRRGINLPGVKLNVPAMTEKDHEDAEFALTLDIDFIALSFVRNASDIEQLRVLINARKPGVQIIAKIEKPEAIEDLAAILAAVDVIMVARGDLGVELGIERVPGAQKMMIREAIRNGIPVITATQMLESMITKPWPTRAEASDVANAVFDGTDALMLSGETASGDYPIESVRIMRQIIAEAERQRFETNYNNLNILDSRASRMGLSLGKAARVLAEQMGACAMACLSDTGNAAIRLTAQRPQIPVFMLSANLRAVRRMAMVRGAYGIKLVAEPAVGTVFPGMEAELKVRGLIRTGDCVVYTAGISHGNKLATNTIHLRTVEAPVHTEHP